MGGPSRRLGGSAVWAIVLPSAMRAAVGAMVVAAPDLVPIVIVAAVLLFGVVALATLSQTVRTLEPAGGRVRRGGRIATPKGLGASSDTYSLRQGRSQAKQWPRIQIRAVARLPDPATNARLTTALGAISQAAYDSQDRWHAVPKHWVIGQRLTIRAAAPLNRRLGAHGATRGAA